MTPRTAMTIVFAVATGSPPAAQKPTTAATAPPLILGRELVHVPSGRPLAKIVEGGYVRNAIPRDGGTFQMQDLIVDPTGRQVLEVRDARLVLRAIPEPIVWRRKLDALGARPDVVRWLCADRVVLSRRDGVLLALHRGTGKTAWQSKADPGVVLKIDRDLVVTTHRDAPRSGELVPSGARHRLVARALRNGARAFTATLPDRALRAAIAPHGVVAIGASYVAAFDRFGPRLFVKKTKVGQLVAHPHGWFALTARKLAAGDKSGKQLWSTPLGRTGGLDRARLSTTAEGDALIVSDQFMSDAGMHCQRHSRRDGAVRWATRIPGLGLSHSKYRHDVYVRQRGARIDVVSEATGGSFFVVLDTRTGEVLTRGPTR